MDALMEEYLARVEGGKEVLAAMKRELSEQGKIAEAVQHMREEERLMHLERAGEARRPAGSLPESFWDLPMPEDPGDSVRRALEEDRG